MSRAKPFIPFLVLVLVLLAAGCGTADINLHTIVHSSGEVTQEVNIKATGLMAEAFKESTADLSEAEAAGWQISKEETKDSISLKMSKRFSRREAEAMTIPLGMGTTSDEPSDGTTKPTMRFDVQDSFFYRDYSLSIKLPPSETRAPSEDGGKEEDLAEMSDEMLKALEEAFSFSWTVTLPGEITETNADERSGNSATWKLGFSSMNQSQEFMIKSRETRWANIGLVGGGAAVIVVGVIVILVLRRRSSTRWETGSI